MKTPGRRCPLLVALVFTLGCGDADHGAMGKVGTGVKQAGADALQAAKDVGNEVGDELADAIASLEAFAKSAASGLSDTGEALAQGVASRMPDVRNLVDKAKLKLAAGGAEMQEQASRLEAKVALLESRLEALAHNAASASREMKDDVVAAFNDVVADIKRSLA